MNIQSYLITESFNEKFNTEHLEFQEQLSSFIEYLQALTKSEKIHYSLELYNQIIFNGESLVEWLYNYGDFRDEKKFFQLKLRHMEEMDDSEIQSTIREIQRKDYNGNKVLVTFFHYLIPNVDSNLIVRNGKDCYNARRFYLSFVEDASSLLKNYQNCFPQLYIHERVNQTLKRMKPFRDYIDEVIRHLAVLNDHAQQLFNEYQGQNETVVLKHLAIKGDIYCSIQGDPAYEKENLGFEFTTDSGEIKSIICAPHTKLFNKHSNERIYFQWGDPLVKKGEKVLIGHIGDHL